MANNYGGWYKVKSACKMQANDMAKYGTPEWPWLAFSSFLPGDDYRTGVVTAVETKAKFQNGFGAMARVEIICRYDLRTGTVLDVTVNDQEQAMTTDNAIAGADQLLSISHCRPPTLLLTTSRTPTTAGIAAIPLAVPSDVSPCGLRGRSMRSRGSVPLWRACLAPLLGRGVAPPPPPLRTAREQFCIFSCTLCRRSSVYYGF